MSCWFIAAPFTEWDSFLFTPPMVLYAQVFSFRSASENHLSCLTEEGPVCLDNKMLQNLAHSKDRCSPRLSAETWSLFCTNFFGYFFFITENIYMFISNYHEIITCHLLSVPLNFYYNYFEVLVVLKFYFMIFSGHELFPVILFYLWWGSHWLMGSYKFLKSF